MKFYQGVWLPSYTPLFIQFSQKRVKRKALVFSHFRKGGKMNIYVIFEYLNEKWQQRNVFNSYAKAADYIHTVREWEKHWVEQGFGYAPKPGIYKIVRFTEAETFTIED